MRVLPTVSGSIVVVAVAVAIVPPEVVVAIAVAIKVSKVIVPVAIAIDVTPAKCTLFKLKA